MKTAFIIHGTFGSPKENWFPWLGDQLHSLSYTVIIPKFPTPENQSLENWQKKFREYKKYLTPESIFIAHSLGVAFILSILEEVDVQVSACYFVSGFLGELGNQKFDTLNQSFTRKKFDWKRIIAHSKYFYLCHVSDDPYIPPESAKLLSENLHIPLDIIPNGGHLNKESGFETFPYLLDIIIQK